MMAATVLVKVLGTTVLRSYADDGTYRDHAMVSGDTLSISPWETTPHWMGEGACQRCGHDFTRHGEYQLLGDGEVWVPHPCREADGCGSWVEFTPWFADAE